jgi:hypothetical protein
MTDRQVHPPDIYEDYEPSYTDNSDGQEPITESWNIRTLKDAYRERPPTEYIVDKYFAIGTLSIVYGAPAVMKSMLMADLCTCIVAGQDWLPGSRENGNGIIVKKSPTFWLDMDNGTRRTDERFDALAKARNLPIDSPLYYLSMPNPPFALDDIDSLLLLIDEINDMQAKFVVIDNLGLSTGNVEENSAGMARIMGYLRILTERTDSAVVVIHHQRKGGAGQSRAGDALRGHSSIEASLDLALHVVREPDSSDITIRSTKTRGVDVPQMRGSFNFEHAPGTHDLAKAWFSGIKQTRGTNAVRSEVMTVVMEHGEISKGRLADVVKERLGAEAPGINNVRNWINELVDVTGELATEKQGKSIIIRLPSHD